MSPSPLASPAASRGPALLCARRRGFTIVELTVVLVVLSLIASFGIPAYFGRPSVTLDSAAKLLAHDLREVQNRAALYEEALVVNFPEDGQGYNATDVALEPLLSPYGAGPFVRDYAHDAVFRGVEIISVETDQGRQIGFDAVGRPQSSARVVLAYEGEQRTVRLRAGSGLIAIEGLDDPWVDLGL